MSIKQYIGGAIEVDEDGEVRIDVGQANGPRRIVRVPTFYICGLNLKYVNPHTIMISEGECVSNEYKYMTCNSPILVDMEIGGVNGLDSTSPEIVNEWYYIYLIMKPDKTISGLISLGNVVPSLPYEYTQYRRIGVIKNNLNGDIIPFRQVGDVVSRYYYYKTELDSSDVVLVNGINSIVWLSVSVLDVIPPTSKLGYFNVRNESNANNIVKTYVRSTGEIYSPIIVSSPKKGVSQIRGWLDISDNYQVDFMSDDNKVTVYISASGFMEDLFIL